MIKFVIKRHRSKKKGKIFYSLTVRQGKFHQILGRFKSRRTAIEAKEKYEKKY